MSIRHGVYIQEEATAVQVPKTGNSSVQVCCLIKRIIHRHDGTDEKYHVLSEISPYGRPYQ